MSGERTLVRYLNGQVRTEPVAEFSNVATQAQTGAVYRVVEYGETGLGLAQDVVVVREGASLHLIYPDGQVVINDFFAPGRDAAIEVPADTPEGRRIYESSLEGALDADDLASGEPEVLHAQGEGVNLLKLAAEQPELFESYQEEVLTETANATASSQSLWSSYQWIAWAAAGAQLASFAVGSEDEAGDDSQSGLPNAAISTATDNFGMTTGALSRGARTDDSTPELNGTLSSTLSSSYTLRVYDGETFIGTATISGTTWTYADTRSLSNGSSPNYSVRLADASGNLGPASTTFHLVIDTEVSAASTGAHTISLSEDTGTISDDRITNQANVTVAMALDTELTLASDERVEISADGITWHRATSANGRDWTTGTGAVALVSGTGTAITARIIDDVGNISTITLTDSDYTLDTATTVLPNGTHTLALDNDTGTDATDRLTGDPQVKITLTLGNALTLAADEVLQISADNGATWIAATDTGGGTSWETADNGVILLTGTGDIRARILDIAGNESELPLTGFDYTYDPVPTTTVTIDRLETDTGTSNTDFITSDDDGLTIVATLSAALETGERLEYSSDGGVTWTDISTSVTGTAVSHTDAGLAASATIHLRVADTAENFGTETNQAVVIDNTIAAAPAGVHTISLSNDSGDEDNDRVTNDSLVQATITLENALTLAADETLQISVDGGTTWIDTTDAGGGLSWATADNAVTLTEGQGTFSARIIDTAGNIQAVTLTSNDYELDISAPTTTATITRIAEDTDTEDDFVTGDSDGLDISAALSSVLSDSERLEYSLDGTTWTDITSDISGDGTITFKADNLTETTDVLLRVRDIAGNVGASTSRTITVNATGFAITGAEAGDYSGRAVSSAGDVNGDGLEDLIVGAYGHDSEAGAAYVIYGKTNGDDVDLTSVGSYGFKISGSETRDWSGRTVSSAGDVNGDGYDDLLVGAPYSDSPNKANAGKSYIVFGGENATDVDVSRLGANGFVINGEADGDWSGWSVSKAGDINGDGLADLVIGAYESDSGGETNVGRSYVVFGKSDADDVTLTGIASGTGGFIITGDAAGDESGWSVSSGGDINGDGLDDLIIGAPSADNGATQAAGKTYVVFGKSGDTTAINLADIEAGTGGFVVIGEAENDKSGWSVASAGDVNGDGLDDLVIGARYADTTAGSNAGKTYVVFGKSNNTNAVNLSAIVDTTTASDDGFVINGAAEKDESGWSIASAGDVNGDGRDDLIIAASRIEGDQSGVSYVVYGKTGQTEINLANIANSSDGFIIQDDVTSGTSGHVVSSAGDVNGDGLDDLIVGAFRSNDLAGKSYVIFGTPDPRDVKFSEFGGTSRHSIDFEGSRSDETFDGTSDSEIIMAGSGNDVLNGGGGSDVLLGGAGDDTIVITDNNIAALNSDFDREARLLARIDGGSGTDTLTLSGSGLHLDITALADNRVEDIEIIDLTGSGDNTLSIHSSDLSDLTSINVFNSGTGWTGLDATVNRYQLLVKGDSGDLLNLYGDLIDTGNTADFESNTYRIFQTDTLQVLVDSDMTLDTTAPQSIAFSSISDDTGSSNTDYTTNDRALTITAELSAAIDTAAGDFIEYSNDGGANWTDITTTPPTVGGSPATTLNGTTLTYIDTTNLTEGSHTLQLRVTDAQGNQGPVAEQAVTIDLTAPSVTIDSISYDNGSSSTDYITNDTTLSVTVTLSEPYSADMVLEYKVDSSWLTVTGIPDGATTHTFSATELNSSSTLEVRYTDAAGNISIAASQAVTIDTTPPTTAVSAIDSISPDTGSDTTDFITSDTTSNLVVSATLNQTLQTGEILEFSRDGGTTWTNISTSVTGTAISYTSTPLTGDTTVSLRVTDLAGNSSIVRSQLIQVDNTSPDATVTIERISEDTGASGTDLNDFLTSDTDGLTVHATLSRSLQTGEILEYSRDGGATWTTINSAIGGVANTTISYTDPDLNPANGATINIRMRIVDAASNDGPEASQDIRFDTNITAAPTGDHTMVLSDDTGDQTDDRITSDRSSQITLTLANPITLQADETLQVSADGGLSWIDTSGSGTSWATGDNAVPLLSGDNRSITARVVDTAGNVSTITLTDSDYKLIDTAPTTTVTISRIDDNTDNADDFTTGDSDGLDVTVTLSQALGENERLQYSIDGTTWTDVTNASAGDTTIVIKAEFLTQTTTLHTRVRDIAGNMGAESSQVITISSNGYIISGAAAGDYSGWSVAHAGDINGDGFDDVIVGAYGAEDGAGKSFVVYGKRDGDEINIGSLGTGGFTISGEGAGDFSGRDVASAGDVNGDGFDDLIIGAYNADPLGRTNAGKSYIIFGSATGTDVNLADIAAGTGGYVIDGSADGDWSGWSVSSAGDVNGDGLDDLVIGAYEVDANGETSGRSYVVFGKSGDTNAVDLGDFGSDGFVIDGAAAGDRSGWSVSKAGDVNGDGLDDVIVSAPSATNGAGETLAGRSYVVFGKTTNTVVDLGNLSTGGFVIEGAEANDQMGWSVASAGDVNGDGLDDVIVGARYADPTAGENAGKSYIVFGKSGTPANQTATVDLSNVETGTGGFVINGETAGDESGWSVSKAGDLNGDGFADVIIGSSQVDASSNNTRSGKSYVVYGKSANTTEINLADIANGNDEGFVIYSDPDDDNSGHSVSAAGDVNGDGLDDLIVGVYGSGELAGKSYVIFGKSNSHNVHLNEFGGNSRHFVDETLIGGTGDDTITGTSRGEMITGGEGNDTLTGGGGADVLLGGVGNDNIIIDGTNITALSQGIDSASRLLARIDGGGGLDTLTLDGANLSLNLRTIANTRAESLEIIDITGSGNNALELSISDVFSLGAVDLFNDNGGWTGLGANVSRHQLLINGDAGDSVRVENLTDTGSTATDGTLTYNIFQADGVQVLIETGIGVSIV